MSRQATWTPDVIGSVCFLAASWLTPLEYSHGTISWKINDFSGSIVWINMPGSIAFGISAVFAFTLPKATALLDVQAVNLWTSSGALCFLIGAYLLLPEMRKDSTQVATT